MLSPKWATRHKVRVGMHAKGLRGDACEKFKRMRTRMLSIPHDELLKSVARRIVDWHVLRLIKLWLKAPNEERDEPRF